MKKYWVAWLGLAAGIGLVGFALAAHRIGIDRTPDWGPARSVLAILGVLGIFLFSDPLFRVFGHLSRMPSVRAALGLRSWTRATIGRPELSNRASRLISPMRDVVNWLERMSGRLLLVGAALLVLLAYFWLVSAGYWTEFPRTSAYYDLLAEGFSRGQAHLPVDPPASLVSLTDPYDYQSRAGIPHIWDASLYSGKYFLYWGPVPALLLTPLKLVSSLEIGDHLFSLCGVIAIFIALIAILRLLERAFGLELPIWMEALAVLTLGLSSPLPWLLSRPEIYEASIAAGQAFYLFSMLTALILVVFPERRLPSLSALSGLLFILSIGSRATLALAGSVPLIAATVAGLPAPGREGIRRSSRVVNLLAVLIPVAVGGMLLGWYNWIRFGDPLELGQRYVLTGRNLNEIYDQVLATKNIPPNLYNYFLNPPRFLEVFPYVKPDWGGHYVWPLIPPTPEMYTAEQVTGLLFSSPLIVWLAALPLVVWQAIGGTRKRPPNEHRNGRNVRSISLVVVGSAASLAMLPVLMYLSGTMRYATDFAPSIMVLSIGCAWLFWDWARLQGKGWRLRAEILYALTCIATATIGFLLGVTGYAARMESLNPELFRRVTELLTP